MIPLGDVPLMIDGARVAVPGYARSLRKALRRRRAVMRKAQTKPPSHAISPSGNGTRHRSHP